LSIRGVLMIQRYYSPDVRSDAQGDLVLYSDYKKLEQLVRELCAGRDDGTCDCNACPISPNPTDIIREDKEKAK